MAATTRCIRNAADFNDQQQILIIGVHRAGELLAILMADEVGPDKLDVVATFCYLGDIHSVGRVCKLAVTTR